MQQNQIERMTDYLFHSDFTKHAEILKDMAVGKIDESTAVFLASVLQDVDSGKGRALWNAQPTKDWSLLDAEIVYNGTNSRSYPTKFKFSQVLVINFHDTERVPFGRMYVQYNLEA